MTEEGEEVFILAEAVVPSASARGIGTLAVGRNNRTDGAEENDAPNLLLGRTLNLRSEEMEELRRQGIYINDDNNPAPENAPIQSETTAGTCNWRREGIICPQKSGNFQNMSDIIIMTPSFV